MRLRKLRLPRDRRARRAAPTAGTDSSYYGSRSDWQILPGGYEAESAGPLGRSRRYRLASGEEGPPRSAGLERLMIHGVAGRPQLKATTITIFRDAMRHPAGVPVISVRQVPWPGIHGARPGRRTVWQLAAVTIIDSL
jgi:hypothetical protein